VLFRGGVRFVLFTARHEGDAFGTQAAYGAALAHAAVHLEPVAGVALVRGVEAEAVPFWLAPDDPDRAAAVGEHPGAGRRRGLVQATAKAGAAEAPDGRDRLLARGVEDVAEPVGDLWFVEGCDVTARPGRNGYRRPAGTPRSVEVGFCRQLGIIAEALRNALAAAEAANALIQLQLPHVA